MNTSESTFIHASPSLWKRFCSDYQLNEFQQSQFAAFGSLLLDWNTKHNLTAITDVSGVISDHFSDSLSITKFLDLRTSRGLADVGAGGGFPGIPLKIMYPELPMMLIEVNAKKIAFLQRVIESLQLPSITTSDLDWRTFLRKTSFDLDLFCARASLRPDELIRMFSPTGHYNHARLVYWASQNWQLEEKEKKYLEREEDYTIENKRRKLLIFACKTPSTLKEKL